MLGRDTGVTVKSEGVVKTEISWAVREHRLLCQRRLRNKTLEISPESLCGGVVPRTNLALLRYVCLRLLYLAIDSRLKIGIAYELQ